MNQQIAVFYGESGCYLDSLIEAGERLTDFAVDRIAFYRRAKERDWILANCYVNEPAEILQDLTLRLWRVHKENAVYKAKTGEVEIMRYEWTQKPGVTLAHFVLGDGQGGVAYDPLGDASPVVKYGNLISKRIFTEIKA